MSRLRSSLLIISGLAAVGCTNTRYEPTQVSYQMAPAKRPAGAVTYAIEAKGVPVEGLTIAGMTASTGTPDVAVKIVAQPPIITWRNEANAFIIEAEAYDGNHKGVMLCREWPRMGLNAPAIAVPAVAMVACWKAAAIKQPIDITLVDKAGKLLDQRTVEAGDQVFFGLPSVPKEAPSQGLNLNIDLSGTKDYTTYQGGILVPLSGQASGDLVRDASRKASMAIPFRHERVWAQGVAQTNVGQPVVAEAEVHGWRDAFRAQVHPGLESAFTQARPGLEQKAVADLTHGMTEKVQSYLQANLASGAGSRKVVLAIPSDDPRFAILTTALSTGGPALLQAQAQLQAVIADPNAKPLMKAIARYDLAIVALGQGRVAEAQDLATQASNEALALPGGLLGSGDDTFTSRAMDFSIELGGGENVPRPNAKPAEKSTLGKINDKLSLMGF